MTNRVYRDFKKWISKKNRHKTLESWDFKILHISENFKTFMTLQNVPMNLCFWRFSARKWAFWASLFLKESFFWAIPNNKAHTVAKFLYQNVFCRYQSPGECIIFDRGEFCNKMVKHMLQLYGVEPRIIASGRPQSNGQAEAYVKQIKAKMKAIMSEHAEDLPNNWDQTIWIQASPYKLCVLIQASTLDLLQVKYCLAGSSFIPLNWIEWMSISRAQSWQSPLLMRSSKFTTTSLAKLHQRLQKRKRNTPSNSIRSTRPRRKPWNSGREWTFNIRSTRTRKLREKEESNGTPIIDPWKSIPLTDKRAQYTFEIRKAGKCRQIRIPSKEFDAFETDYKIYLSQCVWLKNVKLLIEFSPKTVNTTLISSCSLVPIWITSSSWRMALFPPISHPIKATSNAQVGLCPWTRRARSSEMGNLWWKGPSEKPFSKVIAC